jgi:adenylate cyclase
VGQDPAGRILAGAVRLGDIEAVHAAMLLADLRDVSGLSDALAPQAVLPLLNGYLDCVVPAAQRIAARF